MFFNHDETHYFVTSSSIFEGLSINFLEATLINTSQMTTVPKKAKITFNVEIPKTKIKICAIVLCETLGSKTTNRTFSSSQFHMVQC